MTLAGPVSHFLDLRHRGATTGQSYLLSATILVPAYLFSLLYLGVFVSWVLGDSATIGFIDWLIAGGTLNDFVLATIWFPVLGLALYVALMAAHRRPFRTVVTARRRLDWRGFALSFGLWFGLMGCLSLVESLIYPGRYTLTFDAASFLLFLPFALVLTPVQATVEEFLFRGYILQSTAGITQRMMPLALINGLLFLVPHLGNPEIASGFLPTAAIYVGTGVLLALVTLKTGGVEAAAGCHVANNLFLDLVANYEGSVIDTDSIFHVTGSDPLFGVVTWSAAAIVFWCLLFLRRRAYTVAEVELPERDWATDEAQGVSAAPVRPLPVTLGADAPPAWTIRP